MIERTGSGSINSLRQWSTDLKTKTQTAEPSLDAVKKQALEDSKEKFKSKDVTMVKAQSSEDLKISSEIKRLKTWEDHVIQHERMHMLSGGEFSSAPSYTYTRGPDGKRYIQGGEVSMYVPAGTTLEDSEAALEKVKRAAAAPSDPSPQDLKTSAMASARQLSVRKMIKEKQAKEIYEKANQQTLKLKEIKGDPVSVLEKMKFHEVGGFDLFI